MNDFKTKLPFADKDLGQHFLKDDKVIQAICHDFHKESQLILEVGPGPGILTKHLAQHRKPFYVFEKDARFPEILKEFVKEENIFKALKAIPGSEKCSAPDYVDEGVGDFLIPGREGESWSDFADFQAISAKGMVGLKLPDGMSGNEAHRLLKKAQIV